MRWPIAICFGLFLALTGQSFPGYAQEGNDVQDDKVGDRLQQVEKAIREGRKKSGRLGRKAHTLGRELTRVNREKVALARSIQNHEISVIELENEIAELNETEKGKQKLLSDRRLQFSQILLALHRLSSFPPEAIIAYPAKPSTLIRSAILLRSAVPRIEDLAARLREDLIALSDTRTQTANRQKQLAAVRVGLEDNRRILEDLYRKKSVARQQMLAARQIEFARLSKLTREAVTLRDLFMRLEQERVDREPKPEIEKDDENQEFIDESAKMPRKLEPIGQLASKPPFEIRPFSDALGTLAYPAIGRVVGTFGKAVRPGVKRKGLTIETRAGAQVVAPYDGKIVFAGLFRGYGQLLIIEHGEGYHSLLSGMTRIDGEIGQWLLSGEPVGVMDTMSGEAPRLYLELRRKGQPINPSPWLATRKGKVKG